MMIMPSNHSSAGIHFLAGRYPGRIGWLIGPSARKKTKLRPWMSYALDNDAYSAFVKKKAWNEAEWRALLDWAVAASHPPEWVLVPDVVADRDATLAKWKVYAPEVLRLDWPVAFAVQDGMTPADVPPDAAVVFVGGSKKWKWRTVAMWCSEFERVHVGRVNSVHKLRHCGDCGAESADGTGWFRDGSDPTKIPALTDWLAGDRQRQPELKLG